MDTAGFWDPGLGLRVGQVLRYDLRQDLLVAQELPLGSHQPAESWGPTV